MPDEEKKERKLVYLYCNGEVYSYWEDEIHDPPDPPAREKVVPYNEEESDN